MPSLLEKRCQEVESHNNVLSELLIVHAFVTDGNIHACVLLELPLDGSSNIIDLLGDWLGMGDWLWESSDSVKNWSKNDWDLLNERISGEEKSVLLGPLLDKLLVLVELLQLIHGGHINTDVVGGDLVGVLLIGNEADLQVWSWDVWKSDGSNETLILLWVVILEGNLDLDSLGELSSLGLFSHLLDALHDVKHGGIGYLVRHSCIK